MGGPPLLGLILIKVICAMPYVIFVKCPSTTVERPVTKIRQMVAGVSLRPLTIRPGTSGLSRVLPKMPEGLVILGALLDPCGIQAKVEAKERAKILARAKGKVSKLLKPRHLAVSGLRRATVQ